MGNIYSVAYLKTSLEGSSYVTNLTFYVSTVGK